MSFEFALGVSLALIGGALSLAPARWKDTARAQHFYGIATVALFFAAGAVLVMPLLEALGMNRVQVIGMPVGAAIFLFAFASPIIERHAGFRSGGAREASPIPVAMQGHSAASHIAALSVTGEVGRDKRPDWSDFAGRNSNGSIWLGTSTFAEPFGGPPTHTIADQSFGTWTFHNDGVSAVINVEITFAYQWQQLEHTAALSLERTTSITIPRIESNSRAFVRIGNFTSDFVLHISPAARCSFEAPGDTAPRLCSLQGADPTRRENILSLFPGARKAKDDLKKAEQRAEKMPHHEKFGPLVLEALGDRQWHRARDIALSLQGQRAGAEVASVELELQFYAREGVVERNAYTGLWRLAP